MSENFVKTEQEITNIINQYEADPKNPNITGTDTLARFVRWYEKENLEVHTFNVTKNNDLYLFHLLRLILRELKERSLDQKATTIFNEEIHGVI